MGSGLLSTAGKLISYQMCLCPMHHFVPKGTGSCSIDRKYKKQVFVYLFYLFINLFIFIIYFLLYIFISSFHLFLID